MSDVLKTVLVKGKDGPVRVNQSAYDADPEKYKLVTEDNKATKEPVTGQAGTSDPNAPAPGTTPAAPPPPPATQPVPEEIFVTKNGSKWALADKDGKSVDGVDYDTKAAAEAALKARNEGSGAAT